MAGQLKLLFWMLVFLATIIVVTIVASPSREELDAREAKRQEREEQRFTRCLSRKDHEVRMSCTSDPEFTYCGMTRGQGVVGSGCSAEINRLESREEQVEFCFRRSRSKAREICYSD